MIFSIFRFFCTLRFQIYKCCLNRTSMERLFIQLLDDAQISIIIQKDPYDCFSAAGTQFKQKTPVFCLFSSKNSLHFDMFLSEKHCFQSNLASTVSVFVKHTLSGSVEGHGGGVWSAVLHVHHAGLLYVLNSLRQPLHVL